MDSRKPYSREELQAAGHGFPDRGLFCPRCKGLVPQFAELSELDEQRILQLIGKNESVLAMAELRALTSCPERWAKIWVIHSGRADALAVRSCPQCGGPPRTPKAKQFQHCFAD